MAAEVSLPLRIAVTLAAAASVACGSSDEAAPREFRHVDGEAFQVEHGTIRLGQDGYGVALMVLVRENPMIVDCRRAVFGPCAVMTCTRPADTDITLNNTGLIHLEWGSTALDVPTYGDIASYALHPSPPWAAGATISFTADFALGPPIDEKLVAPPLLVLKRPDFEPSFNGAPSAWGVTLDTSRDLHVEWEAIANGVVQANLVCANMKAGQGTVVTCTAPAADGALVAPASVLHHLPTTGCSAGSSIEIVAGDFRDIQTAAWRYRLEVTRDAQTSEGVDASTALTPR
ncbi:MAG: hypothetical protein L6Q84_31940 [Polyangiaceae bacterium]|nr:hypothetical protein [Polyangiaceae bacterium]